MIQGVKIGDGAVIGAGSVVTKDVEPYTIVGGVPARKIKDRFPENIKNELQAIQWWNFDSKELNEKINELLKITNV